MNVVSQGSSLIKGIIFRPGKCSFVDVLLDFSEIKFCKPQAKFVDGHATRSVLLSFAVKQSSLEPDLSRQQSWVITWYLLYMLVSNVVADSLRRRTECNGLQLFDLDDILPFQIC
ncbi:hypothetical protein DPSP01_000273 [Paraphaeosphaeria sporulosa]